MLALLLGAPGASPVRASQPPDLRTVFAAALNAWTYGAYWRLWGMGTRESREALSQDEFARRMDAGNAAPVADMPVQAFQVISMSGDVALVRVGIRLEDRRAHRKAATARPFLMRFEEGAWKVNLWDFVGLAAFFPPHYLPGRLPR